VSGGRVASNALVAIVGASLMLLALRSLGPTPTKITLDAERVLHEREHCQVMFVGPSYVRAQIQTSAFDDASRSLGTPLSSCIFGGTGMRGYELRVHVERLLREPWPKLELVVIDITLGSAPGFDEANWYHPRLIQWHTLDSLRWISGFYASTHWQVSRSQLGAHLKHAGANYLNLGVGLDRAAELGIWARLLTLLGKPTKVPDHEVVRDYRHDNAKFKAAKMKQASAYAKKVSRAAHRTRVERLIARKKREAHRTRDDTWPREMRSALAARGLDTFFVLAPVWRPLAARTVSVPGSAPLVVFDFNDPAKYPVLYARESRGRTHHISWQGGTEYSRLLAKEILSVWKPDRSSKER
jgi:hypothetical protein